MPRGDARRALCRRRTCYDHQRWCFGSKTPSPTSQKCESRSENDILTTRSGREIHLKIHDGRGSAGSSPSSAVAFGPPRRECFGGMPGELYTTAEHATTIRGGVLSSKIPLLTLKTSHFAAFSLPEQDREDCCICECMASRRFEIDGNSGVLQEGTSKSMGNPPLRA